MSTEITEGESIEKKIDRMVETNEPSYRDWETDRKSTRLNSSHITRYRMLVLHRLFSWCKSLVLFLR